MTSARYPGPWERGPWSPLADAPLWENPTRLPPAAAPQPSFLASLADDILSDAEGDALGDAVAALLELLPF